MRRARRPLAYALPGMVLAAALAMATPSPVAAAPAQDAGHCVPAGGPNACAGTQHGRATGAANHGGPRHATRTQANPSPPIAPLIAEPLLAAIFDNNIGVAAPVGRAVGGSAPSAPRATAATTRGGPPPRLGGVLSVPQPILLDGLGPGPAGRGAEPNAWQLIAVAEGVALLALLAALVRRRRAARPQAR